MKKHIQGMALLIVLVFLQVFTLLSLYAIHMAGLEHKIAQQAWHGQLANELTEQALREAVKSTMNTELKCIIPRSPTVTLLSQPLSWWQSPLSCAGNFQRFQYYYVIEILGLDPCAIIDLGAKKQIANYLRITLLGLYGNRKIVLQSTLVKPDDTALICYDQKHIVSRGQQTWQQLFFNG